MVDKWLAPRTDKYLLLKPSATGFQGWNPTVDI